MKKRTTTTTKTLLAHFVYTWKPSTEHQQQEGNCATISAPLGQRSPSNRKCYETVTLCFLAPQASGSGKQRDLFPNQKGNPARCILGRWRRPVLAYVSKDRICVKKEPFSQITKQDRR
ncbi:hypothetical protein E2320_001075 [Naja naja]|nr:hypothetical protein E2320_001075 [Naja naja]